MLRFALAILLVGCSQHPAIPAVDAPGAPCPVAPANACENTCGNGLIDECLLHHVHPENCSSWGPMATEACDGDLVPTCVDLGFYAGAVSCTACESGVSCANGCRVLTGTCDPCPSDVTVISCAPFDGEMSAIAGVAVTNDRLAVALRVPGHVALYDRSPTGLALVADTSTAVSAITSVPGGWLIAKTNIIQPLALDGTLGIEHVLSADDPVDSAVLASGPVNRVLVAWNVVIGTQREAWFAVVDSAGAVVAAPALLFPAGSDLPSVTSDGVSFFVAAADQLARIGADGAVISTTSGFPASPDRAAFVGWGTTGGWYVGASAQRFDATGAMIGGAFALTATPEQIDGDDLIAIATATTGRLELERVGTTGAILGTVELGKGDAQTGVFARRIGGDIAALWSTGTRAYLERVAAP